MPTDRIPVGITSDKRGVLTRIENLYIPFKNYFFHFSNYKLK